LTAKTTKRAYVGAFDDGRVIKTPRFASKTTALCSKTTTRYDTRFKTTCCVRQPRTSWNLNGREVYTTATECVPFWSPHKRPSKLHGKNTERNTQHFERHPRPITTHVPCSTREGRFGVDTTRYSSHTDTMN